MMGNQCNAPCDLAAGRATVGRRGSAGGRGRPVTHLALVAAAAAAALIAGCQVSPADAGFHSIAGVNVYTTPVKVPTAEGFVDLAAGYDHVCGLTAAGKAYCWGSNADLQLGTDAPLALCDHGATPCSPTPVAVAGDHVFHRLSASLRVTCAVDEAGHAWCWGYGVGGQLGNGLSTSSATPMRVASAEPFLDVALGGSGLIVCGLATTAAAYCWGPGGSGGGLGNGTADGSNAPVPVDGGLAFDSLAVGDEHACGLTTTAVAYCWGRNLYGALGTGATWSRSSPDPVAGDLRFAALTAGLAHTCGLAVGGAAYCWGFPLAVGSPTTDSSVTAPVQVDGSRSFTAIRAGGNSTCALDAAGAAWCWGQNLGGKLGDGSQLDRVAPVKVATSIAFTEIRVGGVQVCALDRTGGVYCWGLNTDGAVGQVPIDSP